MYSTKKLKICGDAYQLSCQLLISYTVSLSRGLLHHYCTIPSTNMAADQKLKLTFGEKLDCCISSIFFTLWIKVTY